MCKETLYDAQDDIEYLKLAIAFLKKEQKKEQSIIDIGIKEILNSDKGYVNRLKRDNNLEKFRYSIVYGHINWIINDMNNNYKSNFSNFNESEVTTIPRAYSAIYTYLEEYIDRITDINDKVKIILKDYFHSLAEIY